MVFILQNTLDSKEELQSFTEYLRKILVSMENNGP